ncbi:MAG TPA: 2-amino-4-hydroxy-6-hydroxymethyldihydropteridine diphosphokinase [Sphingobium sp.]|uniref:2-amino-4-hydroxy-6- hydroxymethyldihydropteridine diphosphokinase n=1 Tax=Sphingobium sp. TaxID=1912891 RepID=UPI002ED2FDA7
MGKSSKPRHNKPKKRLYAIAIGSNRPLSRKLPPRAIVAAALDALDRKPLRVKAVAPVITSRPVGPSSRDYANSAAIIRTRLSPPELLARLQKIERRFGRQRRQRWGARTLDLDIVLWEDGACRTPRLIVPHPAYAARDFVLRPLSAIAPRWRDPRTGLSVNHLRARMERPKPVDPTLSTR